MTDSEVYFLKKDDFIRAETDLREIGFLEASGYVCITKDEYVKLLPEYTHKSIERLNETIKIFQNSIEHFISEYEKYTGVKYERTQ